MALMNSHVIYSSIGFCQFMSGNAVFILHLDPHGMLITRDPSVVEKARAQDMQDMANGRRRDFAGAEITPMYATPKSTALDFIHTDYIAKLLESREAQYNSPCTNHCDAKCRIAITAVIQNFLGVDCGSIVGHYLRGKGWPGQPFIETFHELIRAEYCLLDLPSHYLPLTSLYCGCYRCR
jgi:hypothetical protein